MAELQAEPKVWQLTELMALQLIELTAELTAVVVVVVEIE